MAINDRDGVLLSMGSVKRIKRAVDRIDGMGTIPPRTAGASAPWNPGVQRARVSTAIPTGTLSAPSASGEVVLLVKGADGTWGDGDEVAVHNDMTMSASLPVGRACRVAWIAGEWWLVSASCS